MMKNENSQKSLENKRNSDSCSYYAHTVKYFYLCSNGRFSTGMDRCNFVLSDNCHIGKHNVKLRSEQMCTCVWCKKEIEHRPLSEDVGNGDRMHYDCYLDYIDVNWEEVWREAEEFKNNVVW